MEDLECEIEDGKLLIKDEQSRFEDSILAHKHVINIFLVTLCHKSCYFEDIVNLLIFRLRTFCNFFQVCL